MRSSRRTIEGLTLYDFDDWEGEIMSEQDNLALARQMSEEMEQDGTWAELRRGVAEKFPDREFERRFLLVRSDGVPAPALMLRNEPWSDELADHWMACLWETQRVGGFNVQLNDGDKPGEAALTLSGGEDPVGVSLAVIVDLELGRFYCGAPERRPQEAAHLAMQHYLAVMAPPGAVQVGEIEEEEE
jgi:hypothetical protein